MRSIRYKNSAGIVMGLLAYLVTMGSLLAQAENFTSPYSMVPSLVDPSVTKDFYELPRDPSNWSNWSTTSYENWYDLGVIRHVVRSRWGPRFITFPAPVGVWVKDATWQRKRIFAAAAMLMGKYRYAHHHMQVWNVPNEPQWIAAGMMPGAGIDCSDFTTWMYDYGLGVRISSSVVQQAETSDAPVGGTSVRVLTQRIGDMAHGFPRDYQKLAATLCPGDLLFIRRSSRPNAPIAHVVVWLGSYASDMTGRDQHLILDSHGSKIHDSTGRAIPSGPAIRPFREESWYFRCYDHALRLLPLTKSLCSRELIQQGKTE